MVLLPALVVVLLIVALWRMGTGLHRIATALGDGPNRTSVSMALTRSTDHLDALADAQVSQATALERTAKAHEDSLNRI
jgi:hypothetical protein